MSTLLPTDRDLHYSDGSHRWMCPHPNADEDAWADRVRAHTELHRNGYDQGRPRIRRIPTSD